MLDAIRCACGNWLGVRHPDGRIEVRHRGRRLIGRLDEVICERCNEVWRAETTKDRVTDPVLSAAV